MPSNSTSFASFAAYAPPPDEAPAPPRTSMSNAPPRFPPQPVNPNSYQSGAVPTFSNSTAGGFGAVEESVNLWETRFGWRVDAMAAVAYLGGPITGFLLLVLETTNDFIRFHAYQSALLITPLLFLRIFLALVGLSFLGTLLTLVLIVASLGMAFQAFRDANSGDLTRFQLPYIGELADRWVGEE